MFNPFHCFGAKFKIFIVFEQFFSHNCMGWEGAEVCETGTTMRTKWSFLELRVFVPNSFYGGSIKKVTLWDTFSSENFSI